MEFNTLMKFLVIRDKAIVNAGNAASIVLHFVEYRNIPGRAHGYSHVLASFKKLSLLDKETLKMAYAHYLQCEQNFSEPTDSKYRLGKKTEAMYKKGEFVIKMADRNYRWFKRLSSPYGDDGIKLERLRCEVSRVHNKRLRLVNNGGMVAQVVTACETYADDITNLDNRIWLKVLMKRKTETRML